MNNNVTLLDLNEEIANAIGIDLTTLVAHIIAIIVIFVIIYFFIWKKVVAHLNKREKEIRDEIDSASKLNHEASIHKQELESKLSEASTRAKEIVNQANIDASDSRTKIIHKATKDAEHIINNAKGMIEAEKESQKKSQEQASIVAAYKIARKILGKNITEEEQDNFTNTFIKDIEEDEE